MYDTCYIKDPSNTSNKSYIFNAGQGYGVCNTAYSSGGPKEVTLAGYELAKGFVAVKFANDVPGNAAMSINQKTSKTIYKDGSAIGDRVILAGSTVLFYYDGTYYQVVEIWRDPIVDDYRLTTCMRGISSEFVIGPYMLCAINTDGQMQPFVVGNGTGNKTVAEEYEFPIGCNIYYHNSDTAYNAETLFTAKDFLSACNDIDARYSAVTGTNVALYAGADSEVFLRVMLNADRRAWMPYVKTGSTAEIIVSRFNLVLGNYYIHLGYSTNNTGYTFYLEDNNPLYYYGTEGLVPYAKNYVDTMCGDIESILDAIINGTANN